jgi:hypothetical protein
MKILLALCVWVFLFVIVMHHSYEDKGAITDEPQQPTKISVLLSDGKTIYPDRVYLKQDYVQIVMPDGQSITMPSKHIDNISYK